MKPISISLLLTALLTQGCASFTAKPFVYDPDSSRALNISRSAGLTDGLKDTELPKDTVSDIRNSVGFASAHAISAYNNPAGGISGNTGASMAIASWLLTPASPSSRTRYFAWMPVTNNENPTEMLSSIILKATESALSNLGYNFHHETARGKDFSILYISFYDDGKSGCVKTKINPCALVFSLVDPSVNDAPSGIIEPGRKSWVFDSSRKTLNTIKFKKVTDKKINHVEILKTISEYMPSWFHVYIAPNSISDSEDLFKVPAIINNGEFEYFITSK